MLNWNFWVCTGMSTFVQRVRSGWMSCVRYPLVRPCTSTHPSHRIPTPEGLTPLTPSSLDQQLTHLIKTYTLHGTNMLVHCRGGVGRAGLIGCCWLLRLGLC